MRRVRELVAVFRRRDEGGATAVEFALISIPLFAIVFGMIDYGWYFFASQTSGSAASTVTRRMQVGDCWGAGQALTLAKKQAATVTSLSRQIDGSAEAPPTSADLGTAVVGTTQITVKVQANGKLIGFFPLPNDGEITSTVQAQLEHKTSSGSC
jgi:Flp pilus assembly protein TadG